MGLVPQVLGKHKLDFVSVSGKQCCCHGEEVWQGRAGPPRTGTEMRTERRCEHVRSSASSLLVSLQDPCCQRLTWTLLTKEKCALRSPSFSIKLRIYGFESDRQ